MVIKIINKFFDYIDDKINEGDAFDRALKKTCFAFTIVCGGFSFLLFLLCIIFDL